MSAASKHGDYPKDDFAGVTDKDVWFNAAKPEMQLRGVRRAAEKANAAELLNQKSESGMTPLLSAVYHKNVEAVRFLVHNDKVDFDCVSKQSEPVLNVAVKNTDERGQEVFKILLDSGKFDVNKGDRNKATALHAACGYKNAAAAKLLVAHKSVDLEAKDKWGSTALEIAEEEGLDDVVAAIKDK
eukprot:TRINITY_DN56983_c0_g1_i2.p1 TRINITY_DN56983_c0_g1~~TRINITY_DN56983_c0_g1_i2.p1  ORF type:complete len:185 (-),score=98.05 TRINITY_DN56983_c0_g1_i2:18-572(-)